MAKSSIVLLASEDRISRGVMRKEGRVHGFRLRKWRENPVGVVPVAEWLIAMTWRTQVQGNDTDHQSLEIAVVLWWGPCTMVEMDSPRKPPC